MKGFFKIFVIFSIVIAATLAGEEDFGDKAETVSDDTKDKQVFFLSSFKVFYLFF